MNRRTVLQSAGVFGAACLAGCLEGVQDHFVGSVQGVVPIEIYSESDRFYNVQLVAYERETNRQTYEEAYAVTPGENVVPPHLEGVYQTLRVTRFDEDDEPEIREAAITPDTELVVVRLDEEFVVEVRRGESGETITETEDAGASDDVPGADADTDGVPVGDDPDDD
ncbi:hypothetical protein AB7C87_11195 [Natrarchaeobius sp. A-rgal3]|uniref:hypothetical protein n=1 Tax=Natrarchaeobius versutus TaxID=1679078 RepID=UPI00350F172F